MMMRWWRRCSKGDAIRSSPVLMAREKTQVQEVHTPKSVNKVILVGNVGKDPEVKYTPSGVTLAKFSLATNERFKDKSGEWQDRPRWDNSPAGPRRKEIG